jgi:hypothetical protein
VNGRMASHVEAMNHVGERVRAFDLLKRED